MESYKYANRDKKRDGIAQRDKTAMLEVLLPDGGATIIRNGQILQFNLRALVERLLRSLKISPGMRILDSGCVASDVFTLAAELVGPTGLVVGSDSNSET